MTLWDIFSWIANWQLYQNDVNILGLLWSFALTFFAYKRFKLFFENGLFPKPAGKTKRRMWFLLPLLFAIASMVWVQNVVDLGVITSIAVGFGRWVEMAPVVGPLTIWNFLTFYSLAILSVEAITIYFWRQGIWKLFHFTRYSFIALVSMVIFYLIVMVTWGIWDYKQLEDPLRTTFFWLIYPELRIIWALLFVTLIKKPKVAIYNGLSVKKYYVRGEFYDWVTQPRRLEKIFHKKREKQIVEAISKLKFNSTVLDVGCGTGLITRNINGNVIGLDINRWNLQHAKLHSKMATFMIGDCEILPIKSNSIDLVLYTDVLEHLTSPTVALKEIKRVLKQNGILILTVPSKSLVWKFRSLLTSTHPHSEPFHNNFSKKQLLELFKEFKIAEIKKIAYGLEWLVKYSK